MPGYRVVLSGLLFLLMVVSLLLAVGNNVFSTDMDIVEVKQKGSLSDSPHLIATHSSTVLTPENGEDSSSCLSAESCSHTDRSISSKGVFKDSPDIVVQNLKPEKAIEDQMFEMETLELSSLEFKGGLAGMVAQKFIELPVGAQWAHDMEFNIYSAFSEDENLIGISSKTVMCKAGLCKISFGGEDGSLQELGLRALVKELAPLENMSFVVDRRSNESLSLYVGNLSQ